MEQKREPFGLKSLLLCSAAVLTLTIPVQAQDRMRSSAQDRPATQSQSPNANQPSANENRGQRGQERGTTGQSSNPRANETPADTSQPRAGQDRDSPSSSPKSQQRSQSNDNERGRSNPQTQSRDGDRPRDNQQTQSRDDERTQQRNQSSAPERRRNQDSAQTPQNRNGDNAARESGRDSNRQAAQPTEQQRTQITTSIRQANVQPIRNVNFSVSVGTAIPASVRVYPVTSAIVAIYPQYRGYSFVLVEDEVVIIEPRSKKIVTVIDQGRGGSRAAAAPTTRSKLSLSDKQRDVIRRSATERRTTGSAGRVSTMEREVTIGEELPDSVEIESFPDTVYTEVPEIRSYRYIVRDRDVYLVDPAERRVIEVIR